MSELDRLQLQSTITCPHCGDKRTETMPTNACQVLYECPSCQTMLKPHEGECCVFCSFGTVPCPPIQEQQHAKGTEGQSMTGPNNE